MKQNEFEQSQDSQLLHEQYQAESVEVPAASLDKSILQAAHQAVDEGVQAAQEVPVKRLVKRSWYVPAAYAAVLVLSLSVVMKLGFEGVEGLPVPVEMDSMESGSMKTGSMGNEPENRLMMEESSSLKKRMRADSLREQRVEQSQKRQSQKQQRMKSMSVQQQVSHSSVSDEGLVQLQSVRMAEQQNHIDELMKLFNAGEMDRLKVALFQYRIDYPVRVLGEDLPEALRELEVKWSLEVKAAE